jgi:hypothetical protein
MNRQDTSSSFISPHSKCCNEVEKIAIGEFSAVYTMRFLNSSNYNDFDCFMHDLLKWCEEEVEIGRRTSVSLSNKIMPHCSLVLFLWIVSM